MFPPAVTLRCPCLFSSWFGPMVPPVLVPVLWCLWSLAPTPPLLLARWSSLKFASEWSLRTCTAGRSSLGKHSGLARWWPCAYGPLCSVVASPSAGTGTSHTHLSRCWHLKPVESPWPRGSFSTCWHFGPKHTHRRTPSPWKKKTGQTVVIKHGAWLDKHTDQPPVYTQLTPFIPFFPLLSHACSSPIHFDSSLFLPLVLPLNIP